MLRFIGWLVVLVVIIGGCIWAWNNVPQFRDWIHMNVEFFQSL